MIERVLDRRVIGGVVAVGAMLRAFVAMLTPLPAEDAANYLWMAQQFAAGEVAAALSEVFPPLPGLLVAPFVAVGIDAFRAGQLVMVLCGALALWPAMRMCDRLAPGRGLAAGVMLAFAPLAVRVGAQVYSEPVFHLFVALAMWAMVRGRMFAGGVAAGVACWARPEGMLLAAAFVVADRRRGWLGVLPIAGAVVGLGAWRAAVGLGFEPLRKLAFNTARGDAALTESGLDVWQFAEHLVALPGSWLEAFQVFGVLALAGVWVARRDRRLWPFLVVVVLGVIAIAAFLPRRRFLVSWIVLLAPFAVAALGALPERARWPTLFVIALTGLLSSLRLEPTDRIGERQIGDYLAARVGEGERVAGDMTRVIWFAGSRPLPPRHFTAEELIARARAADVRFVVLGTRRDTTEPVRTALEPDFRRHILPEQERRAAEHRGILVLERR